MDVFTVCRSVPGAIAQLRCCVLTNAVTRPTPRATSVNSAVVHLCIEAIWKCTCRCTPQSARSPAPRVENLSRPPRLSTRTRSSTSRRPSQGMCAQSAASHSKQSSDSVPTRSDILGQNRTSVGAAVGLSQTEADSQSICGQSTRHMPGMLARHVGKPPTV